MSFFVTMVDDSYQFTTAGYVAMFLILIAVFVGAAALAQKGKQKKSMSARHLAFCAVSVALAMVTSMIKLYSFPFGGSVTLFSMLFICLPGYFFGVGTGILTAAAYGILQLIIEPYIYFPIQVIVDYVLAFSGPGTFRSLLQCQTRPHQRATSQASSRPLCVFQYFPAGCSSVSMLGRAGIRWLIPWPITELHLLQKV